MWTQSGTVPKGSHCGGPGPATAVPPRGHEDTDTAAFRGSFRRSPSIEGIEEPTAEQLTCSGSGTLPRVAPVARNNWVVGTAGTAGTAGAEDGEDAHSALDQLRRLMWHPNGLEPLEDLKPAKTQSQRQYV